MPSQSAIWLETTTKRFGGWQECVQHLSRSRHLEQIGGQRTGNDGNWPPLQAPSPELLADRRDKMQTY